MKFKTKQELKKMKLELRGEDCDFWYDLTDGGYIDPTLLLEDSNQAIKVMAAIAVIRKFQDAYIEASEEYNED